MGQIILEEQTEPSTPAADKVAVYPKAGGGVYKKDDAGTEVQLKEVGSAPTAHAASHTDGTDDVQDATAAQKGLATATQITKLDGIAALADVTGSNAPQAHAASHKDGASDDLLSAPGAIGGTTPAAIAATTVTASGILSIDDTTDASSTTTGSIHTDGGLGVAKKSFFGDDADFGGNIYMRGAQSCKKTNVADTAYGTSALTSDYIVSFTSLTAARAAVISSEDVASGTATQPRIMVFKDESGSAGTYPITISLENAGTINGASTYVLNTNYEAVNIYLNGTNGFAY